MNSRRHPGAAQQNSSLGPPELDTEAVRHVEDDVHARFGIDPDVFRAAEYIKAHLGGFDPAEFERDAAAAGFGSCETSYEWFLGQGQLMHGVSFDAAATTESHLRRLLPLTAHLFKSGAQTQFKADGVKIAKTYDTPGWLLANAQNEAQQAQAEVAVVLGQLLLGITVVAVVLLLLPFLLVMVGVGAAMLLWFVASAAVLGALAFWLVFPGTYGLAAATRASTSVLIALID